PPLAAALAALLVDRLAARRGLDPPGFAEPWRRYLALVPLAFVFWLGVFVPLAEALRIGGASPPDFSHIPTPRLFLLHALLVATLAVWYLLGFAGTVASGAGFGWREQLGWRAASPRREVGLGIVVGAATWSLVIGMMLLIALLISVFAGEEWLP